jgi:hypothetical protein
MTIHFSNILTFRYFQEAKMNRLIYVDGFLLQLALFFVTLKWYKKKSGLNYHNEMSHELYFYLLASDSSRYGKFSMLPFWSSLDDISIESELLDKIKNDKNIIIGISSPKQDQLAELLNAIYPEKNFYCLGAAVYTKPLYRSEMMFVTLGTMLLSNPKRTVVKIKDSIYSFAKAITVDRSKVKKFASFLS